MLRVSLRNLLVNKLRLLLTIAAVTVGVTFVSGTFVLSDTMVKAFDELYAGLTSGTDVVVKSEAAYKADVATTGGQVRPLDESIVARCAGCRAWRSRRDRSPASRSSWTSTVFRSSRVALRRSAPVSPPTAAWPGPRPFGRAARHRAPGDGARRSHREEGRLRTRRQGRRRAPGRPADASRWSPSSGSGRPTACSAPRWPGFDLATAQQVLGKVGVVDEVDIMAADGTSARELRDRIAERAP